MAAHRGPRPLTLKCKCSPVPLPVLSSMCRQDITYTVKRDGNDREVNLTLGPMPADVLAKWIGQHMLDHAQVDVAKK